MFYVVCSLCSFIRILYGKVYIWENLVYDRHTSELIGEVDNQISSLETAECASYPEISTHILTLMIRGVFLGAATGSPYIVFISTSGMLRSSDIYIYSATRLIYRRLIGQTVYCASIFWHEFIGMGKVYAYCANRQIRHPPCFFGSISTFSTR